MSKHSADEQLARLAELACDKARKLGADAASASALQGNNTKVIIRDGKVEEIKASASRRLSLRLYVKGRFGEHTTSVLDDEKALQRFIARAVDMTAVLMPDKHRALPDPKYYEGRSTANLQIFDPDHAKISTVDRKQRATAAHDAAKQGVGDKLLSVSGGASDSDRLTVMRTTNGFADSHRSTSFSGWATVTIKDPTSSRRPNNWAEGSARFATNLPDPHQVGKEAASRALSAIGTKKIDSVTLPVIVENRAVGRLLGGFLSPLSGWTLDQKRSCFDKSLGQQIAAELLDIVDDPLLPKGWGSRRFDGEGLTSRKRAVIEKGVLRSYFIDDYYGRKLGRPPTSGGSSNLVFTHGTEDLDALCKRAGKAILITEFLGGNSNSLTGDFSHGLGGFLIENGQRSQPIASMNIAANHGQFWKTLQAVGNDPYEQSPKRTPSLLFAPTTVAGK